jgi:ligand-binding sensor domain-containing protein
MSKTAKCSSRRPASFMKSAVLIFAFFILNGVFSWALDPQTDISHYIIDLWTTDSSNIPQNSVLSMAQTRDGYLWIGTYNGLARFDGLRFTVFEKSNTPEIQNDGMLVMAEGANGALWIGTPNGLLCCHEGKFRNYTVADGLAGDFILSLCLDTQGSLWVGTTRGLSCFQNGVFINLKTPAGVELSYVSALCADASNTLWVGTNAGLFSYSTGRFTPYTLAARPKSPFGLSAQPGMVRFGSAQRALPWSHSAGEFLAAIPKMKAFRATVSASFTRIAAVPCGSAPITAA